jgi:hypothetical protein
LIPESDVDPDDTTLFLRQHPRQTMQTAHLDPTFTVGLDPATAAALHTLASTTGRPESDHMVAARPQDIADLLAAEESIRKLEAGAKPLTLAELDEHLSRAGDQQ